MPLLAQRLVVLLDQLLADQEKDRLLAALTDSLISRAVYEKQT